MQFRADFRQHVRVEKAFTARLRHLFRVRLDAVNVPVVGIQGIEHGVQPIGAVGLDDDRRRAQFEGNARLEQLRDRTDKHGGRQRKAREIVDFDAVTGGQANVHPGQNVAELAERLSAGKNLDVVGFEASLLIFEGGRAWGFGEKRDRRCQPSALCPRRLVLRARSRAAQISLKGAFSMRHRLVGQPRVPLAGRAGTLAD